MTGIASCSRLNTSLPPTNARIWLSATFRISINKDFLRLLTEYHGNSGWDAGVSVMWVKEGESMLPMSHYPLYLANTQRFMSPCSDTAASGRRPWTSAPKRPEQGRKLPTSSTSFVIIPTTGWRLTYNTENITLHVHGMTLAVTWAERLISRGFTNADPIPRDSTSASRRNTGPKYKRSTKEEQAATVVLDLTRLSV